MTARTRMLFPQRGQMRGLSPSARARYAMQRQPENVARSDRAAALGIDAVDLCIKPSPCGGSAAIPERLQCAWADPCSQVAPWKAAKGAGGGASASRWSGTPLPTWTDPGCPGRQCRGSEQAAAGGFSSSPREPGGQGGACGTMCHGSPRSLPCSHRRARVSPRTGCISRAAVPRGRGSSGEPAGRADVAEEDLRDRGSAGLARVNAQKIACAAHVGRQLSIRSSNSSVRLMSREPCRKGLTLDLLALLFGPELFIDLLLRLSQCGNCSRCACQIRRPDPLPSP
jgi:hypothetical protein